MKKIVKYIPRFLFYLFGASILGFAIGFCLKSGLGSDPMSTFVQGLALVFNITVAQMNAIANIIEVILTLIINYHHVKLGTILFPFIGSIMIDLSLTMIPASNSLIINALYLIIGLLLFSISVAIVVNSQCGKNPYDALVFALMDRSKLSYAQWRWILDGTMLVIGILLGGVFGVGTIVLLFLLGVMAQWFMDLFAKHQKFIDKYILLK